MGKRGVQGPKGYYYLKASRVDDLVADGAFHEHEVKFAFLLFHCVLLPCLATHKAHGGVGQHWLRNQETCKSAESEDRPLWRLSQSSPGPVRNQRAAPSKFIHLHVTGILQELRI